MDAFDSEKSAAKELSSDTVAAALSGWDFDAMAFVWSASPGSHPLAELFAVRQCRLTSC